MYFYFYDTFVSEKKFEPLLGKIENRLIELGINGRTEKLTVLKNMKELIDDAIEKGAHTIVAVGDDRTLLKTINIAARHKEVLVGYIPIKEKSVFANILGVADPVEACTVVSKRLAKVIDLGIANKDYFIGSAEIPDASKVKIECDGKFKVSATNPDFKLSVQNLGNVFSSDFKRYNARDGLLDVVISPPSSRGLRSLLGKNTGAEDATIFKTKKIKILSEGKSIPVILDDEVTLKTPLEITVESKKIKLIVGRDRII
ncbi:hypothetical protein KKC88_06460 [Patescibacteria group bacterium]|nr:hypothetical protein [Patescibacteria group bacterium]MBU1673735.1 hypothetical protein [Patescibacteria group bacterium]MBU1963102.1 hypothetical protein [Patescibacteria group bacterium]